MTFSWAKTAAKHVQPFGGFRLILYVNIFGVKRTLCPNSGDGITTSWGFGSVRGVNEGKNGRGPSGSLAPGYISSLKKGEEKKDNPAKMSLTF